MAAQPPHPAQPFYAFPKSYAGAFLANRHFIQKVSDKLFSEYQRLFCPRKNCGTRAFRAISDWARDQDKESAATILKRFSEKEDAKVTLVSEEALGLVRATDTDLLALSIFAGTETQVIHKETAKCATSFLSTVLPKPYDNICTALNVPEAGSEHVGPFTIGSLLRCFEGTLISTTNFTVSCIAVDVNSPILNMASWGKDFVATDFIRLKESGVLCVILHLGLVLKMFRKFMETVDKFGARGDGVLYARIPEWYEAPPSQPPQARASE